MNYKIIYEEVLNQTVILRDRFDKTFRELEDMPNDPSVVAMARMKGRQLAAERCRSSREAHCEISAQLAANKELSYTIKELSAVNYEEFEEEVNGH
jgi:hypothetical protein